MSCENVQELISSLVDERIAAGDREKLLQHLDSCTECSASFESMHHIRSELRELAPVRMPAHLQAKLRTAASYERVRRLSLNSFANSRRQWLLRLQMQFENMMRPAFLPFAGGLLSAALAFGYLVPSLSFTPGFGGPATQIFNMPDGVVVGATGEPPRIEPADAATSDYSTVVELTVDNYGRVTDYEVTRGQLTPDLKDMIMFSNFTPATFFGRRTTAKVKIFYGKITSGSGTSSGLRS